MKGPDWGKVGASMPKTPKKSKSPSPECARLVRDLRQELGFNQAELGAETALFGNGYPGGNVEGKSLPIEPTSNSGTSPETQVVGIFGDEPVCIMKLAARHAQDAKSSADEHVRQPRNSACR